MSADSEKFIPTKEAASLVGRTSDYVGRLAREGKIPASRIGRSWVVSKKALLEYFDVQESVKEIKKEKLSQVRKEEYKEVQKPKINLEKSLTVFAQRLPVENFVSFAIAVLVVFGSFSLVHASGLAKLPKIALNAIHEKAVSLNRDIASATNGPRPVYLRNYVVEKKESEAESFEINNVFALALDGFENIGESFEYKNTSKKDSYVVKGDDSPSLAGIWDNYVALGEGIVETSHVLSRAYMDLVTALGKGTLQNALAARDLSRALYRNMFSAYESGVSAYVTSLQNAPDQYAKAVHAFVDHSYSLADTLAKAPLQVGGAILTSSQSIPEGNQKIGSGLRVAMPALGEAVIGGYEDLVYGFVESSYALTESYKDSITRTGNHIGGAYASVRFDLPPKAGKTLAGAFIAVTDAVDESVERAGEYIAHTYVVPVVITMLSEVEDAQRDVEHLSKNLAFEITAKKSLFKNATESTQANVADGVQNFFARLFGRGKDPVLLVNPGPAQTNVVIKKEEEPAVITPGNVVQNFFATTDVNKSYVDAGITSLHAALSAEIQKLTSLNRNQIIQNIQTTHVLNRIEDLKDTILRTPEIIGGTLDDVDIRGSSNFSGNTVSGNEFVGGTANFGTTTVSDITVTNNITAGGTLSVAGLTSNGVLSGPYFTATSTTATSTFAGSFAIDTDGFVYATTTKNVGIGVLSPGALLSLQNATNTQPIATFANDSGSELFRFTNTGYLGIGTTSPYEALSVDGNAVFTGTLTAGATNLSGTLIGTAAEFSSGTTTNATSTNFFATNGRFTNLIGTNATITAATTTNFYASIFDAATAVLTNLMATNATSTNFAVSSLTSGRVPYITTGGQLIDSSALTFDGTTLTGTDLIFTRATTTNATSTNLSVSGTFNAVTGGAQAAGITVNADGYVGINNTNPLFPLDVTVSAAKPGVFRGTTEPRVRFVAGGSNVGLLNGYVGDSFRVYSSSGLPLHIGANESTQLRFTTTEINVSDDLIPTANATYDLGSPSYYWDDAYLDSLTVNNLSAASTSIAGTNNASFSINSDNATSDGEDASLVFYRGVVVPNAVITWDASEDHFDFNQNIFIQNDNGGTATSTLTIRAASGQTGNLFTVQNTAGLELANFDINGYLGLGSSSPSLRLTVGTGTPSSIASSNYYNSGYVTGDFEVDGTIYGTVSGAVTPAGFTEGSVVFAGSGGTLSQDNDNFFWDNSNKRLGIGTSSPYAKLSVAGQAVAEYFTATSTSIASVFPRLTSTNATSTQFAIGSLTSGRIPYATTGGRLVDDADLTFDGSRLTATNFVATSATTTNATSTSFFTSTFGLGAGNYFTSLLGNGLINNGGALSVSTTSLASGFFQNGGNSFGAAAVLGTNDSNSLAFETGGSTRLTINTSGNVGIGTTTPAVKLDIEGEVRIQTNELSGIPAVGGYAGKITRVSNGLFGTPTLAVSDESGAWFPITPTKRVQLTDDATFAVAGASLGTGWFAGQELGTNAGEAAFIAAFETHFPNADTSLINGATGGSAVASYVKTNHWYDPITKTVGPAFKTFAEAVEDSGKTINGIIWTQSTDVFGVETGTLTVAQFKQAQKELLKILHDQYNVPIFFVSGGTPDLEGMVSDENAQALREANIETIAELDYVYPTPAMYDVETITDDVHYTDAGYTTIGTRLGHTVANYFGANIDGITGPYISNVSRLGTTVTVTITHGLGTDFTPTTGINGFHFLDDTSEITINSAVRTDATTITLTLDSTPSSGTEILYYLRAVEAQNQSNFVTDNSSYSLPLQETTIYVAGSAADSDDDTYVDSQTSKNTIFRNFTTELARLTNGGFFGIGTTTPQSILTIQGTSTSAYIFEAAKSDATKTFVIDNTGRVGIGTTTLSNILTISSTTPLIDIIDSDATLHSPGASNAIAFKDGGGNTIGGFGFSPIPSTEHLYISNYNDDGDIRFTGPGAAVTVTIDNTGNVGIGESNPTSKLAVSGGVAIGSGYDTTTAPSNGLIVQGNVGIGTSSPQEILHVGTGSGISAALGGVDGIIIDTAAGRTGGLNFHTPNDRSAAIFWNDTDAYSQGQIRYDHNGDYLRIDTAGAERVRIDSSGRVGIGEASPASELHVNGGSGTAEIIVESGATNFDALVSFMNSSSVKNGFVGYDESLDVIGIVHDSTFGGSTKGLFVDNSGNVGVGTSSPAQLLSVSGGASDTFIQVANTGSSNSSATLYHNGSTGLSATDGLYVGYSNQGYIWNYENTGLQFATNNAARVTINSSGNVGIGTTTPQALLHVTGGFSGALPYAFGNDFVIEDNDTVGVSLLGGDANNQQLFFGSPSDTTGAALQWNHDADLFTIGTQNSGASLAFTTTAGTERVRITNTGNVGIGTTSPTGLLTVNGTVNNAFESLSSAVYASEAYHTGLFKSGVTNASADVLIIDADNSSTRAALKIQGNGGSQEVAFFGSNGNVGFGTTSPEGPLHITSTNFQSGTFDRIGNNNGAANIYIRKARGSIGSLTSVNANDSVSSINASAYDGSTFDTISTIKTVATAVSSGNIAGQLEFQTSNTSGTLNTNLVITSSGNVGVGTTSPQALLSVDEEDAVTALIVAGGASGADVVKFERNVGASTQFVYDGAGGDSRIRLLTGSDQFNLGVDDSTNSFVINSGNNAFGTNNRFVINESGNVGIGTTSPQDLLHIENASSPALRLQDTTNSAVGLIEQGDVNLTISNEYAGSLVFKTSATERARFTSTGNLGLGGETSPDSVLSVKGNVAIGNTYAGSNAAPTNGLIVEGNVGVGTTTVSEKLSVNGNIRISGLSSAGRGIFADNGASNGIFSLTRQNDVETGSLSIAAFGGIGLTGGSTSYNNAVASDYDLYVSSTGNVGIGTTTPDTKLVVGGLAGGAATYSGLVQIANGGDINTEANGLEFKASAFGNGYGWKIVSPDRGSGHVPLVFASRKNSSTWTERLTIDLDGNVGIGTTTPNNKIQVAGLIDFNETTVSTLLGSGAGANLNATGSLLYNTAVGHEAFNTATSSIANTAIGYRALYANTSGSFNVALGTNSLLNNTTGERNMGIGLNTLFDNTTGSYNTAIGDHALRYNVTGSNNTAIGRDASRFNRSATSTTAIGYQAGYGVQNVTSSQNNVFIGYQAGYGNTTGNNNTLIGYQAGYSLTTGSNNILIGNGAVGTSTSATNFLNIGNTLYGDLSSGNIGVGTTSPGYKVHLYDSTNVSTEVAVQNTSTGTNGLGGVRLESDGSNVLFIAHGTGRTASRYGITVADYAELVTTTASGLLIGSTANVPIVFGNSNTERLRIAAGGNVGIGTTTPQFKLSVQETSDTNVFQLYDTDGNCRQNPESGSITTTCSSDARLKSNIADADSALVWLEDIQIREYTVNASGEQRVGVIAQELQQVHPEMVHMGDDGFLSVELPNPWRLLQGVQEVNQKIEERIGPNGTISLDASGNVGIGTSSPAYKVHVLGDVAATSFVNISTQEQKKGITYLDEARKEDILKKLQAIQIAEYRYDHEDDNNPLRLGLIAEEAPSEVLSISGKGVDIYKLATFTLASVQELATRVESLEERVAALEAQGVIPGQGGVFSTSTLKTALSELGVLIEKGFAQFDKLAFRQLIAEKDNDGQGAAGTGVVKLGDKLVLVENKQIKASSKVFVTFTSPVVGSWFITDKANGSFRVNLDVVQPGDVSFDYFIVQTERDVVPTSQTGVVDTEAPVVEILGANPYYITTGTTFTDPGVSITDNVDQNLQYELFVDGYPVAERPLDTSVTGEHVLTYKVLDTAGNLTTATRGVVVGSGAGLGSTSTGTSTPITTATSTPPVEEEVVVEKDVDEVAPVITLIGKAALKITAGDTFTDAGATATDDVDGDITGDIVVAGAVDTATAGLYTLTYTVSDAAGNEASVSRIVTVEAPVEEEEEEVTEEVVE